jgi:ATP-dependent protease ClpP protease subunit
MKALLVIASLILSVNSARALHIKTSKHDITTYKVTAIVGSIDSAMAASVLMQTTANAKLPGERVVLISSPGGSVTAGERIGMILAQERAAGTKVVCVVLGMAHSMAFNILTNCDVKIASDDTEMVAHKIAMSEAVDRMTAKNLREWADRLDALNKKYDEANAKALKLSMAEYNKKADQEYSWPAKELLQIGFLDALIEVIE